MAETPVTVTTATAAVLASNSPFIVVADPDVGGGWLLTLDGERASATSSNRAELFELGREITQWRQAVKDGDILKPPVVVAPPPPPPAPPPVAPTA
jgi:hypothetical protein